MDLRRKPDGSLVVVRDRCFWVDDGNQPIPEHVKPPCVVLQRGGMNFAIEAGDIAPIRRLLDEAEKALPTKDTPQCDHAGAFKPKDNERVHWGEMRMCPACLSIIYPDGSIFTTFPPSATKAEVESSLLEKGNG